MDAPMNDDADNTIAEGSDAPLVRSFVLDFPVIVSGNEILAAGTTIQVNKPMSGSLRGITLTALLQLDYAALETIAPRITVPILHKAYVQGMDPADLMQLGSEVMDFLLPKAAKSAVSPQA